MTNNVDPVTQDPVTGYPANEEQRLEAVRRYDVLDTPPDGAFERLTRLASKLFDTPIAIVSIVDHDRIWFKSRYGLDVEEIDRDPGLCASAILGDVPWVVEDARTDPRTLANPLVAGDFGLQFYAGAPLHTSDGHNLGTICVIDREPRQFSDGERQMLEDFAAIVVDELELRLAARQVTASAREQIRLHEERKGHALQLNDDVVQRLAVAQMSMQLGRSEEAGEQIDKALETVKSVLAEMAADATTFRRAESASAG